MAYNKQMTKTALITLAHASNAVGRTLEDGDIDLADALNINHIYKAWETGKDLDFGQVADSVDEIPEADREELLNAFDNTFDLENDLLERIIEDSLEVLLEGANKLGKQIEEWKKFFRSVRK